MGHVHRRRFHMLPGRQNSRPQALLGHHVDSVCFSFAAFKSLGGLRHHELTSEKIGRFFSHCLRAYGPRWLWELCYATIDAFQSGFFFRWATHLCLLRLPKIPSRVSFRHVLPQGKPRPFCVLSKGKRVHWHRPLQPPAGQFAVGPGRFRLVKFLHVQGCLSTQTNNNPVRTV